MRLIKVLLVSALLLCLTPVLGASGGARVFVPRTPVYYVQPVPAQVFYAPAFADPCSVPVQQNFYAQQNFYRAQRGFFPAQRFFAPGRVFVPGRQRFFGVRAGNVRVFGGFGY